MKKTPLLKKFLLPLWLLVAIALLMLGLLLFGQIRAWSVFSRIRELVLSEGTEQHEDMMVNFYSWPVERKIASSSLILRTEWKLIDGVHRCMIAEVIKRVGSDSRLYRVGDEYPIDNIRAKEGLDLGEGQILFFTGEPPSWQYSSVIRDGRVVGMGGIPFDAIRDLAVQTPKSDH